MATRKKPSWSGTAAPPEVAEAPDPPPSDLSVPVDLADTHVADLDWTGMRGFSLSIERTRLERCRLTGASFEEVELTDCELVDCELSGATFLQLRAARVLFRACRMTGVVSTDAALHDVRFDSCRVDEATLRVKDARYVVVEGCELTHADLQEAVLVDSRFEACNLTRADLSRARCTNVRIGGGTIDGLKGARDLRGVTITEDLLVPMSVLLLGQSGIVVDTGDPDS